MTDPIDRQKAIDTVNAMFERCDTGSIEDYHDLMFEALKVLPSAQPEIIQCKDCKHNPKESWFGCPMSHLSEEQRPETAWCWKGDRKDDEEMMAILKELKEQSNV